jgi:mono/diheme cytochrome c family protein
LLDIIRNGGDRASGSRMPAFGDRLSEDEMAAILDFIKSKWGREEHEFQWWITATSDDS